MRSRIDLPIPAKLPEGAPMPAGNPELAAITLAKKVAAYDKDSLPALVTAIRASGFHILTADRKLVAKPLGKSNGIYFEDGEILDFFRMSTRGYSQSAAGLCDGIDYAIQACGLKPCFRANFSSSLAASLQSKDAGTRFPARFLVALGLNLPQKYDLSNPGDAERAWITPLESLLILRTFSEELHCEIRKRRRQEIQWLSSAGGPAFGQEPLPFTDAPPYVMDRDVNIVTEVWSQGLGRLLEGFGELRGAVVAQYLSLFNAILCSIKVYLTYECLETQFTMLDPGAPLIRTHESAADGEERTLQAKLQINRKKWMDFFDRYRASLALSTGLDFEPPDGGKLSDIAVRWSLPGLTTMARTLDKPVQFKGDIEHGRTDSEGKAQAVLQGVKQKVKMPQNSPPVKKSGRVWVIPAVKNNGFTQAIVDAGGNAIGFATGPIALVNVLNEMILRGKVLAPQQYMLNIIDWTPGSLRIVFSITIKGNGVESSASKHQTTKTVWHVNRSYTAAGWLEPAGPNATLPQVASELQGIPGSRTVFNYVRDSEEWFVDDSEIYDYTSVACAGKDKLVSHGEETFNGPVRDRGHFVNNRPMNYVYDYGTQKMYIEFREPKVDAWQKIYRVLNKVVKTNTREAISFGLYPQLMSRAVTTDMPLGQKKVPHTDPSDLAPGEAIEGSFSYDQPYRKKTVKVTFQFVIKPKYGDEEALTLESLKTSPLEVFLGASPSPVVTEPAEDPDELLTCYTVDAKPTQSLKHARR